MGDEENEEYALTLACYLTHFSPRKMPSLSRSWSRRRRRQPSQSQNFQALFSLLSVLLVLTLLEVFFIDTAFLGPNGSIASVRLSDQDFFISDTGAIEQSAYLQGFASKGQKSATGSVSIDPVLKHQQEPGDADSYGNEAVIIGLETCQQYRNIEKRGADSSLALVGLFQRRSSTFVQLMRKNCHVRRAGSDIFYSIPSTMENFPLTDFPQTTLPVVLIQDPFSWMIDVCRDQPSVLKLEPASSSQDCLDNQETAVRLQHPDFHNETRHDSMTNLYNDWYTPWFSQQPILQQQNPRLVIRSEDLVLHPEKVVTEVCTCMGGAIKDHFRNKASAHVDHFVKRSLESYSKGAIESISKHVDLDMSKLMGYAIPES